jgi:hypothetical protein
MNNPLFFKVRVGLPFIQNYGLEELFAEYGVDLEFWAHEHSYERLWPVYDTTVCDRNSLFRKNLKGLFRFIMVLKVLISIRMLRYIL